MIYAGVSILLMPNYSSAALCCHILSAHTRVGKNVMEEKERVCLASHLSSLGLCEVWNTRRAPFLQFHIPISQMRKLRHGEVIKPAFLHEPSALTSLTSFYC